MISTNGKYHGGAIKDRAGQRFGCLTVEEQAGDMRAKKGVVWWCRCDCGAWALRSTGQLKENANKWCERCAPEDMMGRFRFDRGGAA